MVDPDRKPGLMSRKLLFGTTVGAALFFIIVGVIFWGGFNTAMEVTNTIDFCISCHEMKDNVLEEYKASIHYTNRSGVRATCSDCHVPDPWIHKVVRKTYATSELLHKVLGTVDTPEKFEERRLELARRVWKSMKKTDSRECRNCHAFESMDPEEQKVLSRKQHMNAMEAGNTCIDCHKGIAHKQVRDLLTDEELDVLERPDTANKRPITPKWLAASAKPVKEPVAMAAAPAVASSSPVDWSAIPAYEVTLFYPGQASLEWLLNDRNHDGAQSLKEGDRCLDCHLGGEADVGELVVSGEKLESNPIPGKRSSIVMNVHAAHDSENLYMRFQWEDGEHAPVPYADGGKMDPDNQIKLAVMLTSDDEKVGFSELAGCWQACHHDMHTMPDAPDADTLHASPLAKTLDFSNGVTKYLWESRTGIEVEGKDSNPRGGWDKLKDKAEMQASLDDGQFMDLLRYQSGGEPEDGYILAERVMSGGQGVSFSGGLSDGVWTLEMVRKLTSDQLGDISLSVGGRYNIGFAIHDDYSDNRYHHVSLGFKLGIDDEDAEINAVGQ